MLKKTIILLTLILIGSMSYASEFKNIGYKNLSNGSKIKILFDVGWTDKVKSRDMEHYVVNGSELYSYGGELFYDTECSYIFIKKGSMIGYSDKLFKFFEFSPFDGKINKRELMSDEIAEIFPEFKIIKLSDFSSRTDSYKFKKKKSHVSIMIINDKNIDMSGYSFYTNNADFEKYALNNAIEVTKSGMIELSDESETTEILPCFVILVR